MTHPNIWLQQFDHHRSDLGTLFLTFGFENEFKRLLELRKRNQVKRMLILLKQIYRDMPTAFTELTEDHNPIGLQAFLELINK